MVDIKCVWSETMAALAIDLLKLNNKINTLLISSDIILYNH